MSKTEVSGKQIKDGSIELVDLSAAVSGDITQLKSDVSTLQTDVASKASSASLATVATSGSYNDLSNKPSIPSVVGLASETYVDTAVAGKADSSSLAAVATSGSYNDLSNKPSLFSGSYVDLTNKPSLFDGAYSSLTGAPSLATVATSGSYNDLSNKPTIPSDLDGLSDVAVTSAAKGHFIAHNGTSFVNTRTIEADAAGTVPLTVKGAASQTANLLEVQNSSGTALTSISSGGTVHSSRYTETVANAFNTSLAPSSGTLTVDTSLGNAVLGALNASVTTWAFTNVPTDNSKVTTVTAVIAGNASYTYGDACSVNGSSVSGGVMWSGGTAPTATAGTDIVTFIIVRDSAGTVKVFGSATTNFS